MAEPAAPVPALYAPIKYATWVALALLAASAAYTAWISLSYWSWIAV